MGRGAFQKYQPKNNRLGDKNFPDLHLRNTPPKNRPRKITSKLTLTSPLARRSTNSSIYTVNDSDSESCSSGGEMAMFARASLKLHSKHDGQTDVASSRRGVKNGRPGTGHVSSSKGSAGNQPCKRLKTSGEDQNMVSSNNVASSSVTSNVNTSLPTAAAAKAMPAGSKVKPSKVAETFASLSKSSQQQDTLAAAINGKIAARNSKNGKSMSANMAAAMSASTSDQGYAELKSSSKGQASVASAAKATLVSQHQHSTEASADGKPAASNSKPGKSIDEPLAEFKKSDKYLQHKKIKQEQSMVNLLFDMDDEVKVIDSPVVSAPIKTEPGEYPLSWIERQLAKEREALSSEHQSISSECLALSSERQALSSERQALSCERTALSSERTALLSNNQAVKHEAAAIGTQPSVQPMRPGSHVYMVEDATKYESAARNNSKLVKRSLSPSQQPVGCNAASTAPVKARAVDPVEAAGIRHALFSHAPPKSKGIDLMDEPVHEDSFHNKDLHPSKSPDTQSDGKLMCVEIEFAWLVEEGKYCLGVDEFDWKFVWDYASPALRELLRKGRSSIWKKGGMIVRREVIDEFEIKCEDVAAKLKRGIRRKEMAEVIAAHRVLPYSTAVKMLLVPKKPSPETQLNDASHLDASQKNEPVAKASTESPGCAPAKNASSKTSGKSKTNRKKYKHLNEQEKELAWLYEESILQSAFDGVDIEFVEKYASPGLQTMILAHKSRSSSRWQASLVRQTNPKVKKEFERMREAVKEWLYSGNRRDKTRDVLPSRHSMTASEFKHQMETHAAQAATT